MVIYKFQLRKRGGGLEDEPVSLLTATLFKRNLTATVAPASAR